MVIKLLTNFVDVFRRFFLKFLDHLLLKQAVASGDKSLNL